jgi:hypothetical protein
MWNWFNCYLSGRHEYGPWCEPGTIFLRCVHCGKRSSGWALGPEVQRTAKPTPVTKQRAATAVMAPASNSRVLRFAGRIAAR